MNVISQRTTQTKAGAVNLLTVKNATLVLIELSPPPINGPKAIPRAPDATKIVEIRVRYFTDTVSTI